MSDTQQPSDIPRIPSGIEGLDDITHGGLPAGRITLVAGTAGSGKTVLAAQFIANAAEQGESGVFVTFEESPRAIRENVRSFGWDVAGSEDAGRWAFVDASEDFASDAMVAGGFDLGPLLARVAHAVDQTGARRVAIDAVGALLSRFEDDGTARQGLFKLATALRDAGVTTVLTAERLEDYGPVSYLGFEEFIADNVILLRNPLGQEKRRRTLEVLKMRGGSHAKGEHLFTLRRDRGLVVVPNVGVRFDFGASTERMTAGDTTLDEMLNGGLFARSLTLVTGETGTGKSLVATRFVAGARAPDERALFLSFEESPGQIVRNARRWGIDFSAMEDDGRLRILGDAPESRTLEEHLLRMKDAIDEFRPTRVALDSLTALERVATVESFREYVVGLTFHMKRRDVLGLLTVTAGWMREGSMTDLHVSTITDTIVLLQYVGVDGLRLRGISVPKMRGSDHDKSLREFTIDDRGLHIHSPFRGVSGMATTVTAEQRSVELA
jgi:circadian clock protein KaiC